MNEQLKQKRGLYSRKFTLTDKRIFVEIRSLYKISSYSIGIADLGFEILYQSDNKNRIYKLRAICYLGALVGLSALFFTTNEDANARATLLLFVFGSLSIYFSVKFNQDDIVLYGGERDLTFYRNVPDEATVLKFIDQIMARYKVIVKEKYSTFDSTTTEEDYYDNLSWMRENDIIDMAEFIELKSKFDLLRLM